MMVVEWVQDTVGCTLESAAEGVVITLIVVVAHLAFAFDVYFDVFSFDVLVACWSTTLVFDVEVWVGAAAVVSLGDVYLGLSVLFVTSLTAVVFDVDGVSLSAAVDVDVNVRLSWTTVAGTVLAMIGSSGVMAGNSLFSAQVCLCVTITLFVDSYVRLIAAWTFRISDSDIDIFPSYARGATTLVEFPLNLGCGSFFGDSVTPVRRREDTDRNGDSGVKVQFDWLWGALTLEYLSIIER
jgi:hypothetical protein